MSTGTPAPADVETAGLAGARDASNTRQLLLHAARLRFARSGYSTTTVREIATDAGVNVALINRYFTSKEGLFEECLARVGQELHRPEPADRGLGHVAKQLARQVVGFSSGEGAAQLLLLVRTSGDERADRIRREILRSFGQRLAGIAGWPSGSASDERLILNAQIVLATALGIVQLRSTGLDPLSSATEEDLVGPLGAVLAALLSGPDAPPVGAP